MDEILSLWPIFYFDSYMILEFHVLAQCALVLPVLSVHLPSHGNKHQKNIVPESESMKDTSILFGILMKNAIE